LGLSADYIGPWIEIVIKTSQMLGRAEYSFHVRSVCVIRGKIVVGRKLSPSKDVCILVLEPGETFPDGDKRALHDKMKDFETWILPGLSGRTLCNHNSSSRWKTRQRVKVKEKDVMVKKEVRLMPLLEGIYKPWDASGHWKRQK
jgi:hypothetical protein